MGVQVPPSTPGCVQRPFQISAVGPWPLRYALGMSSPSELHEIDPVVVPIAEEFEISMDEWLADLRDGEPLILSLSTAQLLADARAESE